MKEQKLEALGDDKGGQVLGRSKLPGKKKSSRNSAKGKSTFLPYWRVLELPPLQFVSTTATSSVSTVVFAIWAFKYFCNDTALPLK